MKKRVLSAVLAVLMTFGAAAVPVGNELAENVSLGAFALDEDGMNEMFVRSGDWEVREYLDENEDPYLYITAYYGEDEHIAVPSELDGKPIKGIAACAFAQKIYKDESRHDYEYIANKTALSVSIPKSVESIDPRAFELCEKLESLDIAADNESYAYIDGIIFSKDMKKLFMAFDKNITSAEIPSTVEEISEGAFEGCKNLEVLIVPDSVKTIGGGAFKDCTALKNVVMGEGVKKLDRSMFAGCKDIESVVLSEGIEEIGSCTFADMRKLKYVEIPQSVTSIGERAFGFVIEYGEDKYDYDYFYAEDFTLGVYKDTEGEAYAKRSELTYDIINADSKVDIADCKVELDEYGAVYNGGEFCPQVTVTDNSDDTEGENVLEQYKDYIVEYYNNINAGNGYVLVKGIGKYTGRAEVNFTISKKEITEVELSQDSYIFDGTAKTPDVIVKDGEKVLEKDKDYMLVYSNNVNIGTAVVTVVGSGNYTGVVTKLFAITAVQLPEPKLEKDSFTYNGEAIKPKVTVKDGDTELTEGEDFEVSYTDNKNAGVATAVVVGKGGYSGTYILNFTINAKQIPAPNLEKTSYVYDGTAKKPVAEVKDGDKVLTEGVDYTLSYSSNTNAGKGRVTVSGKGNYKGTATTEFTIEGRKLSNAVLLETQFIYDGKAKTPKVTVTDGNKTLMEGAAYTLSYSKNKNVGTGEVIIKGTGNYTGTLKKSFTILPAKQTVQKLETRYRGFFVDWAQKGSATGYEIQYGTSATFKGASSFKLMQNKPDTCTIGGLVAGKKYYVRVRSYTEVGGKTYYGAWSDAKNITTAKYNFASSVVTGISDKAYTGKAITQNITVKYGGKTLKSGTDYTVTYTANKAIGTATIKLVGKGVYGGVITKTFKINPAKQEIQKLTARSRGFFIDWAQKGSATGYEIQYSLSSKFTPIMKATITNNKQDKLTITGLGSAKKYYVRVRSYTNVGGVKFYGAWSAVKSVTTLK